MEVCIDSTTPRIESQGEGFIRRIAEKWMLTSLEVTSSDVMPSRRLMMDLGEFDRVFHVGDDVLVLPSGGHATPGACGR